MSYHAIFTLLFFIAFVAMVAWVYRPGRRAHYQEQGALPLQTDRRNREDEQ